MPELDRHTARDWIERWDRQQEESLRGDNRLLCAILPAVSPGR